MANCRKRSRQVSAGRKVRKFRHQVRKAKTSGVQKPLKRIEEEILTPEAVAVAVPTEKKRA